MQEKGYKSIAEVAKESKKTKKTVYNHLEKLKDQSDSLEEYIVIIDGAQYLTLKGQAYIYESLGDTSKAKRINKIIAGDTSKNISHTSLKSDHSEENEEQGGNYTQEYITALKTQIKSLEKQVDDKNEQINRLIEIVDTQAKQIAFNEVEKSRLVIDTDSKVAEPKKGLIEKIKNFFKS